MVAIFGPWILGDSRKASLAVKVTVLIAADMFKRIEVEMGDRHEGRCGIRFVGVIDDGDLLIFKFGCHV